MTLVDNLTLGFSEALSLQNLLYCFLGTLLGTAIGVLPGLGPLATISMLLPVTYALDPVAALIMIAGIYYGAQYGGSTTAILVNLPGETSSVVTTLDGYQMARKGRAGGALGIAALGSFVAGTVVTFMIAGFAPAVSELAFSFGPAEYVSLMCLGLIGSIVLARGSLIRALGAIMIGLLLGIVGIDLDTRLPRMTFGLFELSDGVEVVSLAMGLFAFAEVIKNVTRLHSRDLLAQPIGTPLPTREELRQSVGPVLRGTALGAVLGLLPGGGGVLSSYASYALEKKISRHPEEFGKGAVAGVAGPESANNAGAQASFIPMLTLGIPPNSVMALMLGAMAMHNIIPGPQVMTSNPDLFWGLIASMWIGNGMLLILNLPLIWVWIRLLRVNYNVLFPSILVFCCIGLYSVNGGSFDIGLAVICALVGYVLLKLEVEPAPLMLAFIVGPMLEANLKRALLLSRGDPLVLIERPISATLLAIAAVLLLLVVLPIVRKRREEVFEDDD